MLCLAIMLSSCTSSNVSESTSNVSDKSVVEEIPENAIYAAKDEENNISNVITLANAKIELPSGYKYGEKETSYGKAIYIWRKNSEYIVVEEGDVLLAIFEGVDVSTPAEELSEKQAKISIESYINKTFNSFAQNSKTSKTPKVIEGTNWFNFTLTAYGGDECKTTYGDICYSYSYYGVYLLSKDFIKDTHSRVWYGFVFTNDSKGELFLEEEYNSLFTQIKDGFGVQEFYSASQKEYKEEYDYSKGYSYSQLKKLFTKTENYYIIEQEKENVSSNERVEK